VFVDETDFYSQLTKLLVVTKVPIIMTASNYQYISKHLIPILARNKEQISYEVVNYSARRPLSKDLFTICFFIKVLEGSIALMLDQLISLNSA